METEKIKLNTVLFSCAAVILIDFTLVNFFTKWGLPVFALTAIVRIVEITAVLAVVFQLNNGPASIGLSKDTLCYGIKKGILWSLAVGIFTGLVFAATAACGINPFRLIKTGLPETSLDLFFFYLAGGLIGPVAEEIFFRGILFGFFREWGAFFAIIFSTIIFVVVHPLGSAIPVPQIAGGLLFALSYEIEKSLWVPIIIHASGNIAIFTISLL